VLLAISVLTQLAGQQEGHPACTKTECHGYLTVARCELAYGPADATATHCLLLQSIQIRFTFLVPAHPGSLTQTAIKLVLCWLCGIHADHFLCGLSNESCYSVCLAVFAMCFQ